MTDYRSLGLDERDSGGSIGWKYVLTSANTQLVFCHCPVWQSHASVIIHLPEEGKPPTTPTTTTNTNTVQHLRWARHLICLNASWSMSAFNLKHNHFWLNWTHISASAGMNFSLLLLFFLRFVHPFIIKVHKKPTRPLHSPQALGIQLEPRGLEVPASLRPRSGQSPRGRKKQLL